MQITLGKWKTRAGEIAEITSIPELVLDEPVVSAGLICGTVNHEVNTWYIDGAYFTGTTNDKDLIEPYIEPEIQPGYGLNSDPGNDADTPPKVKPINEGPADEEYDAAIDRDIRRSIAMKAMVAMIRNETTNEVGELCSLSYDIADAMMEEEASRYASQS